MFGGNTYGGASWGGVSDAKYVLVSAALAGIGAVAVSVETPAAADAGCRPVARPAVLWVRFVEGSAVIPVFNCDADGNFTEYAPGVSAGRASVANDGTAVEISIKGDVALRVDAGGLEVDELWGMGGSVGDASGARLEFMQDQARLASLTQGGQLAVRRFLEEAPGSVFGFRFSADGSVRVVVAKDGLRFNDMAAEG